MREDPLLLSVNLFLKIEKSQILIVASIEQETM